MKRNLPPLLPNPRSARTCSAAIVFLACAGAPAFASAAVAEFPNRTIRIVTSEAAGASNFAARMIAQSLSPRLGQQIVVENRGGGVIAGEIVTRAEPDGHTLLVYGNTLWLLPLMRKQVPYDPLRDFAPVTLVSRAPAMLVVHPSVAARSVKELIAVARAAPGKLNYASGGAGGISHLATEMFNLMAGIQITRIPFKGTAPALNALLGNHVQVMFATWGGIAANVQAGQLRALGVTSAERSKLAPELPTLAEAGVPGYESTGMFGVFAPAKTPPALIARLNREIVQAVSDPAVRERFQNAGAEVVASTPEQFAKIMRADVARVDKVVKAAGIRDE